MKPKVMAKKVARIALTTDVYPLIPQAQLIKEGEQLRNRSMPRGNGIPMKKASGPIKHTEKMILMMSDSIVNREKMKGKNCKYKHVIKDTMPIEKRIGFLCGN